MQSKPVKLEPTQELAYVIGVIYGDGSAFVTKYKQYVIKLETSSKKFAEEFARCLRIVHGKSTFGKRSKYYYVYVYSKVLVMFLKNRQKCLKVIKLYPCDFVRGFYDSEGGYYSQGTANTLYMFNTDVDTLEIVNEAVKLCTGFKLKLIKHTNNIYALYTGVKNQIAKFLKMVKPSIKYEPRKFHETTYVKECEYCGKEFITRHKNQRFCSRKCFSKWETGKNNPSWRGGKVIKVCEYCGRVFYVFPSAKSHRKFCSNECRYTSKKEVVL